MTKRLHDLIGESSIEYKRDVEVDYSKMEVSDAAQQNFYLQVIASVSFKSVPALSDVDHANELVIGGRNDNVVVMIKPNFPIPGDFAAVFDQQNSSRVFVAHSINGRCTMLDTIGMIVYFNESGGQIGTPKMLGSVFSTDSRNAWIRTVNQPNWFTGSETPTLLEHSEQSIFLLGNVFLFPWVHRDKPSLTIFVVL